MARPDRHGKDPNTAGRKYFRIFNGSGSGLRFNMYARGSTGQSKKPETILYKKLFRDIEEILRSLDGSQNNSDMLRQTLRAIIDSCSEEYGIESGRLYREQGSDFVLIESVGGFGSSIEGKTVSADYEMISKLDKERVLITTPGTPGFDPAIEYQFSSHSYAALMIGGTPRYIMGFGIRHGSMAAGSEDEDSHLHFILESIRTSVGLKLRQGGLESQMRQAREIQMSLLPRALAELPGYDLAAVSIPAEEVGGDIYDCQPIDEGIIGLTIADASGHGLPAALQARDVATGLRMGVAQDQKINTTLEKLNKVINQSGLVSRFISVFYGELEETGSLVFVNGGHCPPLLFCEDGKVYELPSNGPVLGPLPEASYRRSYATIYPGELLVMFSDGIIERTPDNRHGESREFGTEGLIDAVASCRNKSAQEIVDTVIEAVRAFGRNKPWSDDATLMVVKRLPADVFRPKTVLGRVMPISDGAVREG